MSKPIKIQDAEVTICGCTFVVDYNYYEGTPADSLNPADPAEIDIGFVAIKGQPGGNADTLLYAIKLHIGCDSRGELEFRNGFDILQQKLLESHNQ